MTDDENPITENPVVEAATKVASEEVAPPPNEEPEGGEGRPPWADDIIGVLTEVKDAVTGLTPTAPSGDGEAAPPVDLEVDESPSKPPWTHRGYFGGNRS